MTFSRKGMNFRNGELFNSAEMSINMVGMSLVVGNGPLVRIEMPVNRG